MRKYLLQLVAILPVLSWTFVQAQDNVAPRVEEKVRVTGGEKTDFILTRTLMVTGMDSVPYDIARSGTYTIGVGYGIPIGKVLELKIEPRATWHKLYFKPVSPRWFPNAAVDSSLVYEKHRALYAEIPVGLKLKLARNAVEKYQLLLEGGFSAGINLGSSTKVRRLMPSPNDPDLEIKQTVKTNRIWELNPLRWGPYARFGTRYVSLYAFYRMTGLYAPGRKFSDSPTTSRNYPAFPKLEIGLSITI
jgi:hypothetical protein